MKQLILFSLLCACSLAGISQVAPERKQCKEIITSKNRQCLNPAKAGKDYCHVHDKDLPRCIGITGKGVQCQRLVKQKGEKCFQHQFQK